MKYHLEQLSVDQLILRSGHYDRFIFHCDPSAKLTNHFFRMVTGTFFSTITDVPSACNAANSKADLTCALATGILYRIGDKERVPVTVIGRYWSFLLLASQRPSRVKVPSLAPLDV